MIEFIKSLNRSAPKAREGVAIFIAVWLFAAGLFFLSFFNLKTKVKQGFIPVHLSAGQHADYGVERDRGHFRRLDMDVIRLAILDQLGDAAEAGQRVDQVIAMLRTPIPSVQAMVIVSPDGSPDFSAATPTPSDLPQPTRKPTKTDRPSHTPRPTHTPRDHPRATPTMSFIGTETPEPEPTATPEPPVTKKPTKTRKPTKTPRN